MERAIAAARRAFDETSWSTDRAFRKACLQQLKEGLEKHKEELRPQIVAEVGTPVGLTFAIQQDSCIDDMQWDIDMIERYEWEYELGNHEFFGLNSNRLVIREPIGVVGAITPWNFPFMLNLSKITPALAAGCTVILKPAPDTPYSATWIGKIVAEETDIPAGVFNVVTSGDPAKVGDVLTGDPRVDMISFTGSTAVGTRIQETAAKRMKRTLLELGGKSANVVFADCDMARAVASAANVWGFHTGQICIAGTRVLVEKSIYDEFAAKLVATAPKLKIGDPREAGVVMGPLVSALQRDRVERCVAKGREEGATIACGGKRPAHLSRGFYYEPTLFTNATNQMTIAREEVFGPVITMIPFRDEDEAVAIANDSDYGLYGFVWTRDSARGLRVAGRMRTGTVQLNGAPPNPEAPFGGYKRSGIGRDGGRFAMSAYSELKYIGWTA